jgi:hypothetical protein
VVIRDCAGLLVRIRGRGGRDIIKEDDVARVKKVQLY